MSLRDKINHSKWPAVILCLLCTGGAVAYTVRHLTASEADMYKTYFTIDDGKTWFGNAPGSPEQVAPFEHKGKTAVVAHVYECEHGDRFIGYLERYTQEAQPVIVGIRSGNPPKGLSQAGLFGLMGAKEVKKPGQGEWLPIGSPQAQAVREVTCPDGNQQGLVELGL